MTLSPSAARGQRHPNHQQRPQLAHPTPKPPVRNASVAPAGTRGRSAALRQPHPAPNTPTPRPRTRLSLLRSPTARSATTAAPTLHRGSDFDRREGVRFQAALTVKPVHISMERTRSGASTSVEPDTVPLMSGIEPAILFWFYKDEHVCADRLASLRRLNPDRPIYGLFGGAAADASRFERALPELDDFWLYPEAVSADWAWRNGEMLIHRWHQERGRELEWDTVFLAQWDLLTTQPIDSLVSLQRDDIFLSSLRPIAEVQSWWMWTQGEHRAEYEAFMANVRDVYGYEGEALCCQFVVACLPRSFLDRFLTVSSPELGFLEYKLPTLATVFGNPLVDDSRFHVWWPNDPVTGRLPRSRRVLTGSGVNIRLRAILRRPRVGVYHPYRDVFPSSPWSIATRLAAELADDAALARRRVGDRLRHVVLRRS